MRCCRSDWPGLCLFCCYQPLCVVSQQSRFGLFLFHKVSNFTRHPQDQPGQSTCHPCSKGTSAPNDLAKNCTECLPGTFADMPGMAECLDVRGEGCLNVLPQRGYSSCYYTNIQISYMRDGVDCFGGGGLSDITHVF